MWRWCSACEEGCEGLLSDPQQWFSSLSSTMRLIHSCVTFSFTDKHVFVMLVFKESEQQSQYMSQCFTCTMINIYYSLFLLFCGIGNEGQSETLKSGWFHSLWSHSLIPYPGCDVNGCCLRYSLSYWVLLQSWRQTVELALYLVLLYKSRTEGINNRQDGCMRNRRKAHGRGQITK